MNKKAKPAAPPVKVPQAAKPSLVPNPCHACGAQAIPITAGLAVHAWVCSKANCPTVGPRRDSSNKALAAWNSLKPAQAAAPAPAVKAPRKTGQRPPWEESASAPAPRGKAAAPQAAPAPVNAKGKAGKAAAATVAAPAGRPGGIGAFIRELIQKGHETAAILEQVRAKFPHSKATASDVSWNKGKLRKQGVSV